MNYELRIKSLIFLFFLTLLLPGIIKAAGLQVTPSELNFNLPNNELVDQEIVVVNPTADVQIFEVYADDFSKIITARPASFTLESGGRKTVVIEVRSELVESEPGLYQTDLSIIAKPLLDSRFPANTGIKVPVTIAVHSGEERSSVSLPLWVFYVTGVAIALLLFLVYFVRRIKQPRNL